MPQPAPAPMGVRTLVVWSVPAVLIGVGSALVLKLLDWLSELLEGLLWETLPGAAGIEPTAWWWVMLVLTLTGAAVGAIVLLAPGHGGQDSATTDLGGPPPPLLVLPSLFIVVVLGLAGGVSLGPENPIIAINSALAVALVARLTKLPAEMATLFAMAGTIGALFGTPVAAALLFTGLVGAMKTGGSLWDKLFLPVAAAGAGALAMLWLGGQRLFFTLEPVGAMKPVYLLTGTLVAAATTLVGLGMAWLLPRTHRVFHSLRNPMVFTTLGGAVLGVLAIVGGPLTMFKGSEQTGELLSQPDDYSAGQLATFALVKAAALLIAASAGFRGGRIFPALFVGAALGVLAHELAPGIPLALAVSCAVMGMTLVASRDGWVAIFVAIAISGDYTLIPLLCLVILPIWLLVTRGPALVVEEERSATPG